MQATVSDDELEVLIEKTIDGDERARDAVRRTLDPRIEKIPGRRWVTGRISGRADERRDVVTAVMAELYEKECALLRTLLPCLRLRDGSFDRKLATIARHTAIDYVRAHAEYVPGPASSRWATHVAFTDMPDEDCPDALRRMIVDEIVAYAERHLPPKQFEALLPWAAGERKEEIAEALGTIGAEAAVRLVRAAQKRLRDRFAQPGGR
jgi:DNA-directed RNA polymerase specialized sigma24 family protein